MSEKLQVTQEELSKIQEINAEFNKAKMGIGDLELQKQSLLNFIDVLKKDFSKHEQSLIEKYGADSVINIQTGEITKKEK
jgi:hypothetical protein